MSSVLPVITPSISGLDFTALFNNPEFLSFLNIYTQKRVDIAVDKAIEKALPAAVEKVMSDPENPIFIKAVENVLAISDMKILKRLYTHDVMLGLKESYEDEDYLAIPARIEALEQRPITVIEKPIEEKTPDLPTIETTLDQKACKVVEYLKNELKPNDFGEFVIDRKELTAFMQTGIDTALRVKKVSRQLKADIFKRAIELFPDIVYVKRSMSGNKTKLLALKSSTKRTTTPTCTRNTGFGIWA